MTSKEINDQENLELKNILSGLICLRFPDAIKKMSQAYNEISREILDMLVKHNINYDVAVEATLENVLMHLMRNDMVSVLYDKD